MPYVAPVTPVSGTVITVAWATTLINAFAWLRAMTGSADPPGSGYSPDSVSTSATVWAEKVNRLGDTMRGDLQVNRAAASAPTTGYLILGNNTAYYVGNDGGKLVLSPPSGGVQINAGDLVMIGANAGIQLGASSGTRGRLYDASGALTVLRAHNNAFGLYTTDLVTQIFGADNAAAAPVFKGNAIWHAANDGSGSGLDADLLDGVQGSGYALAAAGVPLNAVVWFPTLADLTAAGASWTRHTAADGRLLVGAGTTFSQTFVEATNYGSAWSHTHSADGTLSAAGTGGSGSVASGGGSTADPANHGHDVTGDTSSTSHMPAMRAGVFGRRI